LGFGGGDREGGGMSGRWWERVSPHFWRREFVCRCCGECVIDGKLLEGLEALRAKGGIPVCVLSGYRCVRHNREVGGSPKSQHCVGRAADIAIAGVGPGGVFEWAEQVPIFARGGIGLYPWGGFVHVDVGPGPRRWGWMGGRMVGVAAARAACE